MGAFPFPGGVFIGFHQCRVDVDGAEYLVQPQAVLHRQHELCQQVARVFADDGHAEQLVLAGYGQHLDEALRRAVGNGTIEFVHAVFRDFKGNTFFLSLQFVEADPRNFRVYEG